MTTTRILVDNTALRNKDHIMKTSPTKLLKKHRTGRGGRGPAAAPYKQSPFRQRRRARHEALRAHRDRLAQIAQDTFRTVLTIHGYHEDVLTDSDDDTDSSTPTGTSPAHDGANEGPYHDLKEQIGKTRSETSFYPHYSALLASWEMPLPSLQGSSSTGPEAPGTTTPTSEVSRTYPYTTKIEFATSSVLEAARKASQTTLSLQGGEHRLGVLNDASPKRPGGASLSGGLTLEECLVRQTTLIDSLQNSIAGAQFYAEHRKTNDGSGLHDHSMLYSPHVVVFKNDRGLRISPFHINVISSVPVHAGTVRAKFSIDDTEFKDGVRTVMRERMARALRLFEERGDRVLVLGAFGVGQSCNSPDMVGEIWADLLCARGAKFQGVFERVVFALSAKHRETFEKAFNEKILERDVFTEDFD